MRKSTIYLVISILCLAIFTIICTIYKLPNTFWFNLFRFLLVILTLTFLVLHSFYKDYEFVSTSDNTIEDLRKKYDYLYSIVLVHTRLIYDNLSSDFIKKYSVSINKSDAYLLDFEANIEAFKAQSSKDEINNQFIVIACVMDSLISDWKIQSSIAENIAVIDDLIWLNCELSVSVAFSLMNLSYDDLKENPYIKRLVELLYICYFNEDYGKTTIIENNTMIIELLYEKFSKN